MDHPFEEVLGKCELQLEGGTVKLLGDDQDYVSSIACFRDKCYRRCARDTVQRDAVCRVVIRFER